MVRDAECHRELKIGIILQISIDKPLFIILRLSLQTTDSFVYCAQGESRHRRRSRSHAEKQLICSHLAHPELDTHASEVASTSVDMQSNIGVFART
jgi:hypothetical protein